MVAVGLRAQFFQVEALKDVEGYERGYSLPVRRNLVDCVPAIVSRDGIDPVVFRGGEIFHRDEAAIFRAIIDDRFRDFTLVERIAPTARKRAQRPRSEEHTSELQSLAYLVCRLLLEK